MKRAGRDEQHVISLDRAVLGGNRRAFNQRQAAALPAFARHAGADAAFPARDLVDLIEKNDAVLLDRLDRFEHQLIVVEELVGFLVDQNVVGFGNREPARLGAAAAELAEDVADRDGAHLRARHPRDFEQRQAAARCLHLDLDLLVVEFADTQLAAERLLGGGARALANEGVDHALFGGELGARAHVLAPTLPRLRDGDFHQIADDLLDVAADVAHFGELGRLDLDERRGREPGETAGNLGLAYAGGADHEDV